VNKTCQPHYRNYNLPNGMPCLQGFCKEGVCLRQVHDSIKRIWDIIENVTVDKLVMFMRANIVGTVIILSLVLWIPASCVVSCIDRQRDREEKERVQWFDRTNDNLIRSEEQRRLTIRRVDAPKLRLYIPPPQNH
jgi:disintegrin and metalloproteinase domain-containing protein 17